MMGFKVIAIRVPDVLTSLGLVLTGTSNDSLFSRAAWSITTIDSSGSPYSPLTTSVLTPSLAVATLNPIPKSPRLPYLAFEV